MTKIDKVGGHSVKRTSYQSLPSPKSQLDCFMAENCNCLNLVNFVPSNYLFQKLVIFDESVKVLDTATFGQPKIKWANNQ